MRLALITRDCPRHYFLANKLLSNYLVDEIFIEKKNNNNIIQSNHHNLNWNKAEDKFFGLSTKIIKNVNILSHPINSIHSINEIKEKNINNIVVFGSSILKKNFISSFPYILNLHLGLSPYYRGTLSNLWPIYYKELSCIGSTIHLIDEKIDSGNIISQCRPIFTELDSIHDISCKAILAGFNNLCKVIKQFKELNNLNSFSLVKQQLDQGKLLLNKDMNENVMKIIYSNFNLKLKNDYLKNKKLIDNNFPIVSN